MRHRAGAWVALFTLAAAACGGSEPTFYVRGTAVVVESTAPFANEPDFPGRLESTVSAALSYWGGDWHDLRGRTITVSDEQYVACGGTGHALGCYDGSVWFTTSDPSFGTLPCVEETVLVHEIGHAVIGDPMHLDPRWMQFEPVQQALQGRVGYTAAGQVDCAVYVNTWRHLLGSP